MKTKQEFQKEMLEYLRKNDFNEEVSFKEQRLVKKFTSTIYTLSNGSKVTGEFVKDLVENAGASYLFAAVALQEYTKGKGKASLDKYGKEIEKLNCYLENFDEIYEYAEELNLTTDAQLDDFVKAAGIMAREDWQKQGDFSKLSTYIMLAQYVGDEVKGTGAENEDDGNEL